MRETRAPAGGLVHGRPRPGREVVRRVAKRRGSVTCRWALYSAILIGRLLLAPAFAIAAENDGNNRRALEAPVIGPNLDGLPLSAGLATNPKGYVHDGEIYLFTHANFLSGWRPDGLELCQGESPEVMALYRQRATPADVKEPYELLGAVSACQDVTGEGHTIGGAPAVGGNGKFYLTGNRTRCTKWREGCMDREYLGTVADPANPHYAWRWHPILARSAVGEETFSFGGFVALRSFLHDPAPPESHFPRLESPEGPATLWGYVKWGFLTDANPHRLAAVQIADHSPRLRASWQETRTYVLAESGEWVEAHRLTGELAERPMDVSGEFGSLVLSELFWDPTIPGWGGVGHDTGFSLEPESGCDERLALWYYDPLRPWHLAAWSDHGSTVARELLGTDTVSRYVFSTHTRNTVQLGAFLLDLDGRQYVFRGSTERICFVRPESWWHPWAGSEITVERIPGDDGAG